MKKGTKRLIGLLVFLAIATAAAIFIIQNEGQGSKQAAVKPTEAAENSVANEQEAPEQAFLVYENAEVNCIIDVADSGSVALATGADHISYEVIDGDMPKGLTIAEDGTILGAYPRPMKGRVVTVRASAEGCDPVEAEITINVVKPFLTFTGITLADAKAGVEYAASVAYISDTTEKVTFKLAKGSVLPEGLTLNKNGVITGTPTTVQRGVPFTVVAEAKGYSDTEAVFKLDVIIDHKSNETGTILNYNGGSLAGAKLYVSLFPCNECAKAIIQAGIKEVIYDCDKYADTAGVKASKRMMDAAGVRYHQYHRTGRKIEFEI